MRILVIWFGFWLYGLDSGYQVCILLSEFGERMSGAGREQRAVAKWPIMSFCFLLSEPQRIATGKRRHDEKVEEEAEVEEEEVKNREKGWNIAAASKS